MRHSNSQSIRIWGALAVLLLLFGLVWAVFPFITGQALFGGDVPAPIEPIPAPAFLTGLFGEEMNPLLTAGILAGLVIVLVGGAGATIGFLYTMLNRVVDNTVSNAEFQEKVNVLEQKQKEKLQQLRAGREAPGKPDHAKPRWSTASTTMIYIMFAAFLGLIISRTFYPEVFIERESGLFSPGPIITGILALIALVAGLTWLRPQRIAAVDQTDNEAIPWDTITVVVTGLVIVGLGIGIAVYLNLPV